MNALLSRQCGTSELLLGPEPVVGTVRDLGELQWRLVTEKDTSMYSPEFGSDLVVLDEIHPAASLLDHGTSGLHPEINERFQFQG